MSGLIKMSEAAVLAFHAMIAVVSRDNEMVTNAEIAALLNASGAHLSKVMQRLVKAGYVKSIRGPHGGFVLGKNAGEITLRDIYELFEGNMTHDVCLLETPVCGSNCVFGELFAKVDDMVSGYMEKTTLRDAAEKIEGKVICQ